MNTDQLLQKLRDGEELSLRRQIQLPFVLSLPAILAQISSIVMQYIDASMVGSLGANDSASIGLVSTSTWLFGGVCTSIGAGFTVQVAHKIGAGKPEEARAITKLAFLVAIGFSLLLSLLGSAISPFLPEWLGGDASIVKNASAYFLIYAMSLPLHQLNAVCSGLLQCSGNMKIPGFTHVLMCILDVFFNAMLIYPSGVRHILGISFYLPGIGMGVTGAALGTALAKLVGSSILLFFIFFRSPALKLKRGEKIPKHSGYIKNAFRIAVPIGFESMIMSGAQVIATRIVSPLGTVSIAANSFAVTAESLCYMPGYGIGTAATTLIGQSLGADRKSLARRLAWISTILGMFIMGVMGVLMYIAAPVMIGILSPDESIRALGASVLRIEAFAEPLYAASIVASGALRGAGDTLVPSLLNFASMWLVRLPVAAILAPRIGLSGVWIAMAAELCVRGILMMIRLSSKKWSK